ncbi:hypothetical protein AwDysgo_08890 [Bacteroidales bacterium]|nr:hypothetical protein AwDysgo_08890 [Bacteroidales bacterium]
MKTTNKIKTTAFGLFLLFFVGCTSDFDDLNTNPDTSSSTTSSMLATNLIIAHAKTGGKEGSDFLSKRLFWGEQVYNIQYNRIGKGSFEQIREITNAQKMVDLCTDDRKNAYIGLYYYMKAWAFYSATMTMGDVPYSEALQIEKFRTPKYDEQKDVFKGILHDLEQADSYFAIATKSMEGDPFYGGDPKLWRKAANVFRLKVLLNLEKRVADTPELKVKETFKKVVSEGNIFESNADNLKITYSDKAGQQNPFHKNNTRSIDTYAGTKTIIDPLKQLKDYRLFYYFAPAQALTESLYLPEGASLLQRNDWNAYNGLNAAGDFGEEQKKIAARMHPRLNDIYRTSYIGTPALRLSYADMNLILAEAAEIGWIDGVAKTYYEKGIRASFEYVRSSVPDEEKYTQGMSITNQYITDYLSSPEVAYANGNTQKDRLKKIWLQATLGSFLHLAWDSYYQYRRTAYPELPINPETNLNDMKDRIPVRWLYPEWETNYNREQVRIALERQWGGAEDINKIMWIIK